MVCTCGRPMRGDGHNLPFEVYRHVIYGKAGFDLSVDPAFLPEASKLSEAFFECPVTVTRREEANLVTLAVEAPRSHCTVNLYADPAMGAYGSLEQLTATSFDRVPFACSQVLEAFGQGDTRGIPEFSGETAQTLLRSAPPKSFAELISLAGRLHGGDDVLAYRDDVYREVASALLRRGITDTGLAYRVMTDTRRGVYARDGIPEGLQNQLASLGMEEDFLRRIASIRYLFPKAHGTTCVKTAATLMWYKLNYPKELAQTVPLDK